MPSLADAFIRLRVDEDQVRRDAERGLGKVDAGKAGARAGASYGAKFSSALGRIARHIEIPAPPSRPWLSLTHHITGTGDALKVLERRASLISRVWAGLNLATGLLESSVSALIGTVGSLTSALTAAGIGAGAYGLAAFGSIAKVSEALKKQAEALQTRTPAAAEKARAAFAALTPAQQDFARALDRAKQAYTGWADRLSRPVLGPLTKALGLVTPLLRDLTPFVQEASKAFGDLFSSLGKAERSDRTRAWLEAMRPLVRPVLEGLARSIGNVISMIGGITKAFAPFAVGVIDGLERMTARWADWAWGLEHHSGFRAMIDMWKNNWPTVRDDLGHLMGIVVNIVKAMASMLTPGNSRSLWQFFHPLLAAIEALSEHPLLVQALLYLTMIGKAGGPIVAVFNSLKSGWGTFAGIVSSLTGGRISLGMQGAGNTMMAASANMQRAADTMAGASGLGGGGGARVPRGGGRLGGLLAGFTEAGLIIAGAYIAKGFLNTVKIGGGPGGKGGAGLGDVIAPSLWSEFTSPAYRKKVHDAWWSLIHKVIGSEPVDVPVRWKPGAWAAFKAEGAHQGGKAADAAWRAFSAGPTAQNALNQPVFTRAWTAFTSGAAKAGSRAGQALSQPVRGAFTSALLASQGFREGSNEDAGKLRQHWVSQMGLIRDAIYGRTREGKGDFTNLGALARTQGTETRKHWASQMAMLRDAIYGAAKNGGDHVADAGARMRNQGTETRKHWQRQMGMLQQAINGVHSRQVNITVTGTGDWSVKAIQHRRQEGPPNPVNPQVARGWLVSGGIPGRDSVLLRAMPGELVVPRPMVRAGLVDHLRGLIPGFAAGGLIRRTADAVTGSYRGTPPGLGQWAARADAATARAIEEAVARATYAGMKAALAADIGSGPSTWRRLWAIVRGSGIPGLTLTSAYRPGGASYHALGEAIDVASAGAGSTDPRNPMNRLYRWLYANYHRQTLELIHWPYGGIKNGRDVAGSFWPTSVWLQHMNHVHWAAATYDRGGWLPPGLSVAVNRTGRPEYILPPGRAPVTVNLGPVTVREAADLDLIVRRLDFSIRSAGFG